MRLLLIFILPATIVCADTMSDLKVRLAALKGDTPISARMDLQTSGAEGEGDEPTQLDGRATATVSEGPEGVTITYARDSVERAEAETAAKDGGSRDFGSRFALRSIEAKEVHENLNAAPFLLRQLERGELVGESDDTLDGKPAKLVVVKVTPRLNPQAKKFLKEVNVTARIWLGADGLPVAARIRQERKGRALLVISFEADDDDEYRYRIVGDRLVVLHHTRVTTGSGAGQHSNSKMVVELKPAADAKN